MYGYQESNILVVESIKGMNTFEKVPVNARIMMRKNP